MTEQCGGDCGDCGGCELGTARALMLVVEDNYPLACVCCALVGGIVADLWIWLT